MARTYELVRHDIPKMEIQVDFATLEQVVASDSILPKLLGITGLNNPDMFNATYPYTLTVVAKKLGYEIWHHAKELVRQIKKEKGIDINESDNKYHIKVKSGASEKSAVHKYSEAFVDLLRKVQQQLPYEIEKI